MDIRHAGVVILGLCVAMACASRHMTTSAQARSAQPPDTAQARSTQPSDPAQGSAPQQRGTSPESATQQPGTHAIVLGVGSPVISAERSGTSIGIAAGGTLYLFDAGAGIERRIMEAHSQLQKIGVQKMGPVFITHLHQDHTTGLAALLAYHTFGAGLVLIGPGDQTPFTVYGPAPADNPKPGDVIPEWDRSITEKMNHIVAAFGSRVPPNVIKIHPGVVYRDANLTVSAFEESHIPGSFGYHIQTGDRSIVITGDTRPIDAVVTACNGCDLLFHEVFGVMDNPTNATAEYHTSATALGYIARRAKTKHLVIYHSAQVSESQALEAVGKSFSGNVSFAKDLDVF